MTTCYPIRLCGPVFNIALLVALGVVNTTAAAGQEGTAMEAKIMLQRAAAAVETNESAALKSFTAGTNGFKDRDLYVFCAGPDGKISAHGANAKLAGRNFCGFIDRAGKRFGQEMCSNANRTIKTVEYMWPRPGETAPSHKVSYYTMAGTQICGVGFYQ
jgi:signal transduction histidine kinase